MPVPPDRLCAWCRGPLPPGCRSDTVYCNQSHRQAAHRFGAGAVARRRATEPLCFAYADPPYLGKARRYYREHPDYAGEVDHGALLSRLQGFNGWALSASASSLPVVLAIAEARLLRVHVAAWFRGSRPGVSSYPRSAWEPVIYAGGRRVVSRDAGEDALIKVARPRRTDPARVVGAKPAAFCYWLFQLLGALPGDHLVDLFPGSGGVARAWDLYTSRAADIDASCRPDEHASCGPDEHASRAAARDVSQDLG